MCVLVVLSAVQCSAVQMRMRLVEGRDEGAGRGQEESSAQAARRDWRLGYSGAPDLLSSAALVGSHIAPASVDAHSAHSCTAQTARPRGLAHWVGGSPFIMSQISLRHALLHPARTPPRSITQVRRVSDATAQACILVFQLVNRLRRLTEIPSLALPALAERAGTLGLTYRSPMDNARSQTKRGDRHSGKDRGRSASTLNLTPPSAPGPVTPLGLCLYQLRYATYAVNTSSR